MYSIDEIKVLHLEPTSLCNASCPMCLRNISGGPVNPRLPLTEISLTTIQQWLPKEIIEGLKLIYMCGNHGDPAVAKDTLEIFEYFRKSNPKVILQMYTNGSIRKPSWWSELAKIVDTVRFSIDGLEDTNGIYRRGTNFNRIMENMKAFIAAGGNAEWDFVVFKHNEHQIEEANLLSKQLGCTKFIAKRTNRFSARTRSPDGNQQQILDKDLKVVGSLQMPDRKEFRNKAVESNSSKIAGEINFESRPIDCKAIKEESIYISAEGHVFPCCWTAGALYPWHAEPKSSYMWNLINQTGLGIEGLSLSNHSLPAIINGDFFQSVLPNSWKCNSQESQPPLCCSKICGQKLDGYNEQFVPLN